MRMDIILNSKNISHKQKNRIRKSMHELFFLLKSKILNNNCEMIITGSTLNIYTLNISDTIITCDCPDFLYSNKKNMYCKHICFAICYIGKIRDERVFTEHKITEEDKNKILARLVSNFDEDDDDIILCKVLTDKYENLNLNKNTKNNKIEARNIEEDCSICYLPLTNSESNIEQKPKCNLNKSKMDPEPILSICKECNNAIHTNCLKTWLKYNETCVFCRKNWKKEPNISNGYINISL